MITADKLWIWQKSVCFLQTLYKNEQNTLKINGWEMLEDTKKVVNVAAHFSKVNF